MAINFQSLTLTRPTQEHGALATAMIPMVNAGDLNALRSAAVPLGFQDIGNNQYQHPDGSWVAHNPTSNRIDRGFQNIVFRGLPANVATLPAIPWAQAANTALARIEPAILTDVAAIAAHLAPFGFAPVLPNYFSHADGSWVAATANGLVLGFGQNTVTPPARRARPVATPTQAAPNQGASPAQAQVTPAANTASTAPTVQSVVGYAQAAPAYEDGFLACAQLPFMQPGNIATDRTMLTGQGFSEKSPGYFEHADSSWVAYANNRIERGKGQQIFNRVPVGVARQQATGPAGTHFALAIADAAIKGLTAAAIAKSDKALVDKGFQKVLPNFYRHTDQSFVVVVNGAVHFGHAQQLLTSAPDPAQFPQIAVSFDIVKQSAALWSLPTAAAEAKTELAKRGFTESRPGFFQLGQSWVLIEASKVIFGFGNNRLEAAPSPDGLAKVKSNAAHRWLAIARTADLKHDDPVLAQRLGGLGFQSGGSGFYVHPDGSWIAVADKLIRGSGDQVFTDIPTPLDPSEVRQWTTLPSMRWSWWQENNQAIAKLPMLSGLANDRPTLEKLGYQSPSDPNTGRWQHLDGSWVDYSGGYFALLGWQQWSLGQLPYNDRVPGR